MARTTEELLAYSKEVIARYDNKKNEIKPDFIKDNAGKVAVAATLWTGICIGTGYIPAAIAGASIAIGYGGLYKLRRNQLAQSK